MKPQGQKGIPDCHGNPSCMAADVNNTEEITVKCTETNTGDCRASGRVSHHRESVIVHTSD